MNGKIAPPSAIMTCNGQLVGDWMSETRGLHFPCLAGLWRVRNVSCYLLIFAPTNRHRVRKPQIRTGYACTISEPLLLFARPMALPGRLGTATAAC